MQNLLLLCAGVNPLVTGAGSEAEAAKIARSVASSSLTKLMLVVIETKRVEPATNMMDHKRSPVSIQQGSLYLFDTKKTEGRFIHVLQGKKREVGERVAALQQLVSPYGKTDTASVLLEAMEYIHFLHDQVKVLSAPYLQSDPTDQYQDLDSYNLRSKGLCLVPSSYTMGVASSNGEDIWAPIKTHSPT